MKNILFVILGLPVSAGGVQRVTQLISDKLTERGYGCYFAYWKEDSLYYNEKNKLKIDITQDELSITEQMESFMLHNNIHIIISQSTFIPQLINVFRLLLRNNQFVLYSFLHASPDMYLKQLLITRSLPFKYIIKNISKRLLFGFTHSYANNWKGMYELSTKFVLLSGRFIPLFQTICSLPNSQKLMAIPNPLTYSEGIGDCGLLKKEKVVLIVARLAEQQKRILVALDIWKMIERKVSDWQLLILGDGPDKKIYEKFILENNLHHVSLLGHIEDPLPYYHKSSIFMMTSVWEGLPMTLIEAQQNGCVAVAFDNFLSVYDIINDNVNGYVIPGNNRRLFIDKMLLLMSDSDLRLKFQLNGINNSCKFQIDNVINEWEKLLSNK